MISPGERLNVQQAPYPTELDDLVNTTKSRSEYRMWLGHQDRGQGCSGLTLEIYAVVEDSRNPGKTINVRHLFPVPAAAYNRRAWQRWLFERIAEVDRHELAEFFLVDGERVYAPHHSEGEDPYTIFEISDQATADKKWTER